MFASRKTDMSSFLKHGSIVGGVVTTPDLDAALEDYHGRLGLDVVERGALAADLADSWGCPASAGARTATLRPQSGAHCFIRLIEQAVPDDFRPTRTYGWAAYELTVQDVYGWPERLAGSGFDIVGPPREIAGLPYFVPMQVTGRGREMIYLNEVRENTPSSDLPKAKSPTDHIFIVILATPDRAAAVDWYLQKLGLEEGGTYTLEYTMINKAFGLPDGTQSSITMVQKARLPIIEVDDYPDAAIIRPGDERRLPAGNALVSLAVDSLDALKLDFITPPVARVQLPYGGRRAATVFGPAGERVELIEIG
jgi:catechol 2,3-dioxygenase-like lactoylglutathione lyase family enzyme